MTFKKGENVVVFTTSPFLFNIFSEYFNLARTDIRDEDWVRYSMLWISVFIIFEIFFFKSFDLSSFNLFRRFDWTIFERSTSPFPARYLLLLSSQFFNKLSISVNVGEMDIKAFISGLVSWVINFSFLVSSTLLNSIDSWKLLFSEFKELFVWRY